MTISPQSMQKSESREKQMPPSTPVERKVERIEKQNAHSSPGRLDVVKRSNLSRSLGSKQSGEGLRLSNMKWKKKKQKQKSLIQVTMESGEAEPYPDSVGLKRMQMNAHRYRDIYKKKRMDVLSGKLNLHSQLASSAKQEVQSGKAESGLRSIGVKRKETDARSYKAKLNKKRMVDTLPDVDEELEGSNILSQVGGGDVREIDSEQRGKKEDLRYECSGRMVEKIRVEHVNKANGAPERCISSLRGSDVDALENDISAESIPGHSVMDKPLEPPDGNVFEKSGIAYAVRESVNDTGTVLTNISSTDNMEVPESASLTQLGRSLGGFMDAVNCEKHIYPNGMRSTMDSELDHTSMDAGKNVCSAVVDNAPSSLHERENDNLLGLRVECAEKRRTISIDVDMDEPEEIIASSDEQRSLQQKQAPKDKVSGSEIKDNKKRIKEKCDKGIKKLVQQQWEEIQEFHRIWEEKRVQLENGYKLDSAFIRCIYGQGSMRINKLKLLDEDIAKKIEEHKILKDMNLKVLEAKQLAALKDEREKVAYFLAKAKACCSEIQSVDDPHLLESQSEDPGRSQAIAKITVTGPENVLRSEQHIEEQSHNKIVCDLHGDDVMPSNTSVTVSAEAVGCTVPTETVNNLINIIPERRMGIVHCERTSVVTAEPPKELNPHGERVSDIIPLSEQSKEVFTVVPEAVCTDIVGHGCSVESHNAHLRVYDKVYKVDLPENVMNQSKEADKLINGVRSLLPLEQAIASTDHCGLITQSQVAQDEYNQCSVSAELQDQDAPVTKNQSTTAVEETILEAVEAATSVQSNLEVIENCERLLPVPAYISPGCNHVPASEVEHQPQDEARSSSQIAEASLHLTKELEALSYQAPSQSGGSLELHPPVSHVNSTLDGEILEPAEAVTSVQSNHEVIENCEQLHQVSAYVSPGCDQFSASEVEHQTQDEARRSSQVAESSSIHLIGIEQLTNQATTQSGGNLELHPPVAPVDSTLDVAILESVDAVTSIQPNHEVIGNREQLQQVSFYVSPGCDQVSASEVEHQGQDEERSYSQTAEASPHLAEELEALAYQANSQCGGNSELHPPVANVVSTLDGNHLDLGSPNRVENEPSCELNNSAVINVTMSEAVTSTLGLPNQAALQLGEHVTHLHGPSNLLVYPFHHVGSWNPTSSFHAKPLEDELHRLQKECEQVIKVHEDNKSQLKSDCKKEIQEIITQICDKYARKLQDAEATYCLRKNELDSNYNKVFMHKILAEAFKSECFNLRPSQHPGTQEAMQSGYMQNLNHPFRPTSVRPSPEISACRPASGLHTTAPNVQPVQLCVSHSTRPSNVAGSSSSQPVQPLQRGPALSHNVPTRPPHIGTLTPSTGNVRVGREIHAQAPHLQAFRPAASKYVASVAAFPPSVPRQRASILRPVDSSPFSQHPPQQAPPVQYQPLLRSHSQTPQPVFTNSVSHGLLAPPSISQSTQEMRMDMDNQPRVQDLPSNVVYLSDDD
ncbi:unnamed protein product [Fraxinus pennsylvanica]|uniref:Uncharacterized protein n=1 Tax=Fraxinus pennsylvanica TaxID=56036 RepID=A0AAD1ZJ95_9LAMI|nr:unnamed protein product [Fraxinus pennsylvanica]